MGLFLRLQPEEVEGFFPLPAVPVPQLKMVDPPPASTGGAKSQPLAEQNRFGRRHLWRNGYDLGAPHSIRAADSVALGCVALAPHFDFQTLRFSEEIFLKLVVIHNTWL